MSLRGKSGNQRLLPQRAQRASPSVPRSRAEWSPQITRRTSLQPLPLVLFAIKPPLEQLMCTNTSWYLPLCSSPPTRGGGSEYESGFKDSHQQGGLVRDIENPPLHGQLKIKIWRHFFFFLISIEIAFFSECKKYEPDLKVTELLELAR